MNIFIQKESFCTFHYVYGKSVLFKDQSSKQDDYTTDYASLSNSGQTKVSLSEEFRIADNTVGIIIRDTCEAIFMELKGDYMQVSITRQQ